MANERKRPARWLSGLLIALLLFAVGGSHVSASTTDTDGDGLANSFETAYGLNPHAIDSDHDGLLDPAEDLDGDGLGNLGEQMFGTKPTTADTDHDGVNDGSDNTGDGIADWREQDNRPLPDPVTPPLSDPANDVYCYQFGIGSTGKCVGDPHGSKLVAIYGDSHAGQWIASLQVIALHRHWRLAGYAKSGCPSVHVDTHNPAPWFKSECKAYRQATEAAMRKNPPRLVILTNRSWYNGVDSEAWADGLRRVLSALPASSRVMVLADTPNMQLQVPECLQAHPEDIGTCGLARSDAYVAGHNRLEKSIAKSRGASFATMNPWVCPTQLCPTVVGHLLIWRDMDHLTVRYAQQLAPSLGALVAARMR